MHGFGVWFEVRTQYSGSVGFWRMFGCFGEDDLLKGRGFCWLRLELLRLDVGTPTGAN